MATTRAFKSGNSQAVRIPAELAFPDLEELKISRNGDVVTIMPSRFNLRGAVAKLRSMPKPDDVELIERTEVPDRPGL